MSAPVLSGDLKAIPLADVLLLLNNNHKTGTLRCTRAGVVKSIEWEKGEIVFARSTAEEDRLGSYLLRHGAVTPELLQAAAPRVSSQERLGRALVRLGALTPSRLWSAVRGQVTEIVYSLFHWPEGEFDVREGPPSAEKIALETTVMNLIMEGTRRLDEWSRVRQKIHSDRVVLAPVKTLEEVSRSVDLSEFDRTAMALVDGRRTVRDIVALAGRGEFETWQALYALLSAGVIRVQLLAFDPAAPAAKPRTPPADDEVLDRTIERYGQRVAVLLDRARAAGGPAEVARLRKSLREARFEKADLLKEPAIEPDGRMNRHVLLANVAEYPPGERGRALEEALEHLTGMLLQELKGKVRIDDLGGIADPGEERPA